MLLCLTIFTSLTFILADKNLFSSRYTLRWFEMLPYLFVMLVFIIEFFAVREFFEKIPNTFIELLERNIISEIKTDPKVAKKFIVFIANFDARLNYRVSVILVPVVLIVAIFSLMSSGLLPGIHQPEYPISAVIVNVFTLLVPMTVIAYAVGVFAWKCIITGYFIHQFSVLFNLTIQPSHPDKSSGLKPLGDLVFSMALILVIASLAFSVIVIFLNPTMQAIYNYVLSIYIESNEILSPPYLLKTILGANILLGGALLLSLIVFFLPLLSAYRRMYKEKLALLARLTDVTNRIADIESQARSTKIDQKKRNDLLSEIESLTKVYNLISKAPVWPFDRDLLLKFLTPQIASLLSFLGVVEPIGNLIASWFRN